MIDGGTAPEALHVHLEDRGVMHEMRLSAAERLAKEIKPSFVYIFKVNEALEFTGAHLAHLLDDPLGKVLARLRREDLTGNPAPNKKKISMSASRVGISIAPTGEVLRRTLQSICGADPHTYAAKKAAQLNKLGFESRPFELKLKLALPGPEAVVDAFLGLIKNIPASDVSSTVTRFGIKAPLSSHSVDAATFTIQPAPLDSCTITVRGDALSVPAVFRGKVFVALIPNLPRKHFKILFDTDFLAITLRQTELKIDLRSPANTQSPSN